MGLLITAQMFIARSMMKQQEYVPMETIALIYTGPRVTQSASIIYATTKQAPAFMRQMLVDIV